MLAAKSGLSTVTLNMIESETVQPRKTSLEAIRKSLEAGGVEFLGADGGGVGVRLRAGGPLGPGGRPFSILAGSPDD